MKRRLMRLVCLLMICFLARATAETPSVTGTVIEIEKYGHALLDVTIEGFQEAGFTLGDEVLVKTGSYEGTMPFLSGYYVDTGECMVRAYPGQTNIALCINYGKFGEMAGIGVGDPVTIELYETGGARILEEINHLVYTNDIADYGGDEAVFANFRMVDSEGLSAGRLYRSGSPVDNTNGRAAVTDRLIEAAQVRTVMNMSDTAEEIDAAIAAEGYCFPYYASLYQNGHVIALAMPINYMSDDFGQDMVRGMTFLSEQETPYLVHCIEGKDRSGLAVMLLQMLTGASEEEIVREYMLSYTNYYGVEAGTAQYRMLADKNVLEMMRFVCGLQKDVSLDGVDLQKGARTYLSACGMDSEALDRLMAKLQ